MQSGSPAFTRTGDFACKNGYGLMPKFSSRTVLVDAVLWNPPVAKETKMDRELKALLLVVALLTTAGALAQEGTASFAALDQDKDGMISVTEARGDKKIAAQFATADKNQDGFLSRAEFDAISAR